MKIEDSLAAALATPDRSQRQTLLMQIVRADLANGAAWYHLRQTLDDPAQIAECDRRIAATGYQPPDQPPSYQPPALSPLAVAMDISDTPTVAPYAGHGNLGSQVAMDISGTPMVAPPGAAYQPGTRRTGAGLASLWLWIGLVVGGLVLVLVLVVAVRSGLAESPGVQGVWYEATYVNNPRTLATQTDFVQVNESSYTRTAQGIQLTVVWSVRNNETRTTTYSGFNKLILDAEGQLHRPTSMDPDYPLEGKHQTYPMKVHYTLPGNTDVSKLIWLRFNDIDDKVSYRIQLTPEQR